MTDEVCYSNSPVGKHSKDFLFFNIKDIFIETSVIFYTYIPREYGDSTPHPPHKLGTFSHWRRLTGILS